MKHVFKQLRIYHPTTKIGKSYNPCQFKTGCVIIDLEYISAIGECAIFETEDKTDKEVLDWLEERRLILAQIILKDGTKINHILVPNMDYFNVIFNDITKLE